MRSMVRGIWAAVLLAACVTTSDGPSAHLYTDSGGDAAYHASVAGLQACGYRILSADAVAGTIEAKSDDHVARIQIGVKDGRTRVHLLLAATDGEIVKGAPPYDRIIRAIQEALK